MCSGTCPHFSELGFAKVAAPSALHEAARQVVLDGRLQAAQLEEQPPRQQHLGFLLGAERPTYVEASSELRSAALRELRPLAEQFAGVELEPVVAYGVRLYHNGSSVAMHTDVPSSHVIGGILHVERSADAQPWPVVIEAFDGRSHAVELQPGELLLYEAAKCLHGRPRPLSGAWYANLFVHFKPPASRWDVTLPGLVQRLPAPLPILDRPWAEAPADVVSYVEEGLLAAAGAPALSRAHLRAMPPLQVEAIGMIEQSCPEQWGCDVTGSGSPLGTTTVAAALLGGGTLALALVAGLAVGRRAGAGATAGTSKTNKAAAAAAKAKMNKRRGR